MKSAVVPKIIAIVLNWNLPDVTCVCVENLVACDYPNLLVIVVDNGSTDDSVSTIRSRFPGVEMVALPVNRGYAAGNNAGIVRALDAGADWILLVNNDATLAPDAVSQMLAAGGPKIGLIMPRIDEKLSGRLWRAGSRVHGLYPLPRRLAERDFVDGTPLEIDFAVGCVLMIRRDVFEGVGFLDERYFMYYEDLDFSSRVRAAGYRIMVAPKARAWHTVGASLQRNSPRRTYLLTRFRTVWCRSQALDVAGIAWWAALTLASLRTLIDAETHGDLNRAAAVIRGLRDGLWQSNEHSLPT